MGNNIGNTKGKERRQSKSEKSIPQATVITPEIRDCLNSFQETIADKTIPRDSIYAVAVDRFLEQYQEQQYGGGSQ